MKVIISTVTPTISSDVDPRFGRAANFVVVDSETFEWQGFPNPATHASGGAGIQAAQFVANQKADAVISGDFGPNAFDALHTAGVAMYLFSANGTAHDAIVRFKAGQLERVGTLTAAAHRGNWR